MKCGCQAAVFMSKTVFSSGPVYNVGCTWFEIYGSTTNENSLFSELGNELRTVLCNYSVRWVISSESDDENYNAVHGTRRTIAVFKRTNRW